MINNSIASPRNGSSEPPGKMQQNKYFYLIPMWLNHDKVLFISQFTICYILDEQLI